MRPLKFESCLSVPNELRLDKNVPRLRPDVADGATNSGDSSPDSARLCPDWPPNHQRAYFSPVARVNHEWATIESRLTLQRNEPPRTSPGFYRFCHGGATNHAESAWFGLIRGSAPIKVFGASSRLAKNHQDSSRLTTNLLRFTPNHPDSATTHPDSPRLHDS